MAQFAKNVANEEMADEGNAFGNAVRKAKADGIQPGEKVSVGGKQYPVKEAIPTGLEEKLGSKQLKKFAKLAPPKDKITFADKIAGAKKEVDEMLGDVAADAMRNALGHVKKNRAGEMDESWDDMMKDVKQRAHSTAGMKTGERKRSSTGGEIEKTATGMRHHAGKHYSGGDEEDKKADDGAPKKKGRPAGPAKKPERVTGKAWKHKSGRKVKEGDDTGEYDNEGDALKDNVHTIRREVDELEKIIGDKENLPEWVQEKLAQAKGMIMAASEYMQTQHERGEEDATGEEGITMGEKAPPGAKAERMVKHIKAGYAKDGKITPKEKSIAYATAWKAKKAGKVEEEDTDTRDNRAEKAGRKVTKDIEYDEKKKDSIHGKRRGAEDAKAEKAGKKVAKHIEYDEKRKVKETTTSGSVATAAPNGNAKTGSMSFGKGVYEGINSQVEKMITEGMNVSINADAEGHKSITVSADGEEAENLAQLLRLAGMHKEPEAACPTCGQAPCGCDEQVDENSPDWPTNTESSPNAMQYSGGLNGPKSTGQTTVPVIAGRGGRQGTMEENVTIERSLFKLFNEYKAK
jgi:hypothetical protein